MRAWLQPALDALATGEAAILVHLVELKGSGPREVGAQMLVTEHAIVDTIGGGEFERTAIQRARELLHSGGAGVLRLALGPELNQCCGGSVTIAFEPFAPADLAWLKKLARAADEPTPILRTIRLDNAGALRREWETAEQASDFEAQITLAIGAPSPLEGEGGRRSRPGEGESSDLPSAQDRPPPPHPPASRAPPSRGEGGASLAAIIRERINPQPQAFWLFGAGHVGRAVAYAVAPLGFAITWIDGRSGQFPEPRPAGIRCLELAMPELAVDEAPHDTVFAVMTHSHPLDEAICDAILRRDDFAFLGLIGSATKLARFVKRLGEAGIAAERLARLVCPIGLPSIRSKEPTAIAASFAADLLVRRERNLLRAEAAARHG